METSPADWQAETDASWLEAVRSEDGRTLILTVSDNDSGAERTATVSIYAGDAYQSVRVSQLADNAGFPRYRQMFGIYEGWGVMSPSGRYFGGMEYSYEGENSVETYHPVIIDMYTDEKFYYGTFPATELWLYQTFAVSDQGMLFIQETEEYNTIAFDMNGNYFTVEAPAGMRMATVQGTSADGQYWVGYAQEIETLMYYGVIWENGVPRVLPSPSKNSYGEELGIGVLARGISADGSVIYGSIWDTNDFGMVYWTDFNAEPQTVGKDVYKLETQIIDTGEGMVEEKVFHGMKNMNATLTNVSNSGRWIAGNYDNNCAAFYNTETETTVIVEDYGTSTGIHVTDDGIAFIGIGNLGVTDGAVYDLNAKTGLGSTEKWVLDNFGINIPAGYINYINPDRDVILGTFGYEAPPLGLDFMPFIIAPSLE